MNTSKRAMSTNLVDNIRSCLLVKVIMIVFLITFSVNALSQNCYQLVTERGNVVYQSTKPPYSLAIPEVGDPRREASHQRGERLMVFRDSNCTYFDLASNNVQIPISKHVYSDSNRVLESNAPNIDVQVANQQYMPPLEKKSSNIATQKHFSNTHEQESWSKNTLSPGNHAINVSVIVDNPRAFWAMFVESVPGSLLMYGLVWFFFKLKLRSEFKIGVERQVLGIFVTIIGTALFRLVAIITFAGASAYSPSAETGEAGLYILVVPGVIALAYLAYVWDSLSGAGDKNIRPPLDEGPA